MTSPEIAKRIDGASTARSSASPRVSIVVPVHQHPRVLDRLSASSANEPGIAEVLLVCTPSTAESMRSFATRSGMRLVVAQADATYSDLFRLGVKSARGAVVMMLQEHETLEDRRQHAAVLASGLLAQLATTRRSLR